MGRLRAGAGNPRRAGTRDPRDGGVPVGERACKLLAPARVEREHAPVGVRRDRVEAAARERRLPGARGDDRLGPAPSRGVRRDRRAARAQLVEHRPRAVVVLDRPTPLRPSRQLDEAERLEPAHVVSDGAERHAELLRQLDGAGQLAVAQDPQDPHARGMAERLDDALVDLVCVRLGGHAPQSPAPPTHVLPAMMSDPGGYETRQGRHSARMPVPTRS